MTERVLVEIAGCRVVKCSSCHADIIFAPHRGSLMPIDAETHPAGNLAVIDGTYVIVRECNHPEMFPGGLRRSHFATCPAAAKHRKRA